MPFFNSFDGVRLHYCDEGQGPAVIALAGLTRNGSDFDYVAPHLTQCRLIRLDYRGRGRSDWADWQTYSLVAEGRDTLALMDHLGLENAAILGTSRGGLIAMGLAGMAKDRLNGVALNDIGPDLSEAGLGVIRDYLGRAPKAASLAEMAGLLGQSAGFANIPANRWQAEAEKRYLETPNGLALAYDPQLRRAVLSASSNFAPDLWPFFDALEGLPLALIRGMNSNLLTLDTAAEMARRRPDMLWAEVPDRGHVPFLDEPEAVSGLQNWLEMLP